MIEEIQQYGNVIFAISIIMLIIYGVAPVQVQSAVGGAIGLLGTGAQFVFGGMQSALGETSTGADTLSIQSGTYDGDEISITLAASGSGGYHQGVLLPSDIEALTGYRPSGSYELKVEVVEHSCEYIISENEQEFYRWKYKLTDFLTYDGSTSDSAPLLNSVCTPSSSTQTTGYVTKVQDFEYTRRVWCHAYTREAKAGGSYNINQEDPYAKVKITLTTGGKDYEIIVDSNSKQGEIEGVMKVKFIGSFLGFQSCPPLSSDNVVWRPANTADLQLKDKFIVNSARSSCGYVTFRTAPYCTDGINAIAASTGDDAFLCDFPEGEGTRLTCQPYEAPTIPVLQVTLPAATITLVEPEGKPEIGEVTVGQVEAADFAQVLVEVTNKGEDASFDVSLDCERLSPTSNRVYLASGETQIVDVRYSSAGIITRCDVKVVDVNHPTVQDTKSVTIDITPFCDVGLPSPNHVMAYTEYGCQPVCPKQYSTNLFEGDCTPINYAEKGETYSDEHTSWRCLEGDDETCVEWEEVITTLTKNDWEDEMRELHKDEGHCVGERKYTSIGSYLSGEMKFVPENKPNQVWLQAPYCTHVDVWGYYNGRKILDNYEFHANTAPPAGSSEEFGFSVPTETVLPGEIPSWERISWEFENLTGVSCWFTSIVLAVILAIGGVFWNRGG